jgi:flavin-dependent dehydrogenase
MTERIYDAVIVGARCAGASLAALMARRGATVLLLDRDRLPSDQPISTHTIHPPGMDVLDEIGIGEEVRRGLRPMRTLRLQKNDATVDLPFDGRPEYCPRRARLDRLLQEAAVAAGADLLDQTRVTALIEEDGRVVGVRASRNGREHTYRARLVVGADGRRSTVASLVQAEEYLAYDAPRGAYWSYWNMPPIWHDRERYPFDMYVGNQRGAARVIFQTDNDQLLIASAPTLDMCREWRRDPLAALTADLAANPLTGPLVAGNPPTEPVRGTISERYFFRRASGPGWVLVGDAGHHKDFLIGDGITEALLQVRKLIDAIDLQSDAALNAWWRQRDLEALPWFYFAEEQGRPGPPGELDCVVFEQVARDEALRRAMVKTVEHQISPYALLTVAQVARWALGAALRGRLRVVPEFFASGKRATAMQKEIAHRQVLAARAREAMA